MDVPAFVDAAWLRSHPEAVLVDVRWALDGSQTREHYLVGHLPGAVYLDLDDDLSAPPGGTAGRHPLPSPEAFAASLAAAGIGNDDLVVAYDQDVGAVAARLVWMLRATGHRAAVLEGGLAAWDGPLDTGEVVRRPVAREPRPWPQDRVADAELVEQLRRDPTATVIDARAPERYRGEQEPIDPRAGHIPGALNVPHAGNVDRHGRLRSLQELRARYADALAADEVVVYCGSGVTACHDVLVLEQLGKPARLFPASWSGWSSDPGRPAATGD